MNPNKRTRLISFVTLAVVIAAAFLVYQRNKPSSEFTIGVGTFSTAIDYAPFYIARHHKWMEAELAKAVGDEASIRYGYEFTSLGEIRGAIQKDQLHVLFSAEAPAIILQSGGDIELEFVAVACTLQQEIIVQASSGIRAANDLTGITVAVLTGTSSHYGLLNVLEQNSISPSSIEILDMGPGAASAAFDRKEIDAWAVWPPFPEKKQLDGSGIILRGGDAVIQSVMTRTKNTDDEMKSAQIAIVAAIQRAKAWMLRNPEEAQSIVAKETGESLDVVKLAWPKHDWTAELDDAVIVDMQAKADFLENVEPTVANRRVNIKSEMLP